MASSLQIECPMMIVQADIKAGQESGSSELAALFAEEVGLVLEVEDSVEAEVVKAYQDAGLSATSIGRTTDEPSISIAVDSQPCISGDTREFGH